MTTTISRRHALIALATAATTCAALPACAGAAAKLPALESNNPTAMALGYVEDATKVDVSKNPTWKAGSTCLNCNLIAEPKTGARVGCTLFPGKSVTAKGWCRTWIKKV